MTPGTSSIPLGIERHLRRALKDAWTGHRRSFKRCRVRFSEESVHDLRVDTRRLLALLELFGTLLGDEDIAAARCRLKRILRRFAPLRDVQVQLLYFEKRCRQSSCARALRQSLRDQEKQITKKLRKRMRSARIAKLKPAMEHVRAALRHSVSTGLGRSRNVAALLKGLARSYEIVLNRLGKTREGKVESIHELRVAFKKYRYMVEQLQEFLPGVSRPKLKRMQALQTQMGEIQDAAVLLDTLKQFCSEQSRWRGMARPLIRELEARCARLARTFLKRADQLQKFGPFPDASTPRIPA